MWTAGPECLLLPIGLVKGIKQGKNFIFLKWRGKYLLMKMSVLEFWRPPLTSIWTRSSRKVWQISDAWLTISCDSIALDDLQVKHTGGSLFGLFKSYARFRQNFLKKCTKKWTVAEFIDYYFIYQSVQLAIHTYQPQCSNHWHQEMNKYNNQQSCYDAM